MKAILDYFRRRPQSQVFLIRLLVYIVLAVIAREAIDTETLVALLLGVIGTDFAGTKIGESRTTPVTDPKLGAGREMPPALRTAALAVADLLPGPIPELFQRYGVDGLWALVKAAENGVKRAPNQDELDKKALEGA